MDSHRLASFLKSYDVPYHLVQGDVNGGLRVITEARFEQQVIALVRLLPEIARVDVTSPGILYLTLRASSQVHSGTVKAEGL